MAKRLRLQEPRGILERHTARSLCPANMRRAKGVEELFCSGGGAGGLHSAQRQGARMEAHCHHMAPGPAQLCTVRAIDPGVLGASLGESCGFYVRSGGSGL